MAPKNEHSFEQSARQLLTKYDIPEGDLTTTFIALGALQDREREPLELVVFQRAYREMYKAIEDVYRPRTPLEAQLEYERERRKLLELTGQDVGPWSEGYSAPLRPVCPTDGAILREGLCPFCDTETTSG